MKKHPFPLRAILIAVLTVASSSAFATPQPGANMIAKKSKTTEPAKPVGEVVEYAQLEDRVGQTLVIETTMKTTRQGKLMKYTQPALTLQLGADAGAIELTVPRETIKTITVLTPAAEPVNNQGTSGAKKN